MREHIKTFLYTYGIHQKTQEKEPKGPRAYVLDSSFPRCDPSSFAERWKTMAIEAMQLSESEDKIKRDPVGVLREASQPSNQLDI